MRVIEKRKTAKNLTFSALLLALCILLPMLTGEIPQIGNALCPMHIPVLLCGFICGPAYASVVGLIAPPLRFALFGMPPLIPVGTAMCFELAVYGAVSGLLYASLPKKTGFIYVSLITAMIAGRIVWGVAMLTVLRVSGQYFTWELFIAGALINAVPGIVLHIVLIPVLVFALKRSRLLAAR